MTKDTPTPRTDALVEANRGKPCSQSVDCDFARTLERELAEANEAVRIQNGAIVSGANKLIAARAELAACRAALRELVDSFDMHRNAFLQVHAEPKIHAMERMADAWSAARAILQSDTTGEGDGK